MQIYFDGYNDDILIFEANETIPSNSPVMVTSNGTVSTALGRFCGICKDVKNGYAAVQLQGYVVVPYINAPEIGYSKLSAARGRVTVDNTYGREYLVINVDSSTHTVGFIL